MSYTPNLLKRWTLPSCYSGATWDGYFSSGFGQSRDSDALERSNFEVAWKCLSEVSDRVEIVRANHWAVGWVEWIAIPEDDSDALREADKMADAIRQYPVLDDHDFTEKENEEANEVWTNCYSVKERIAYIRKRRSQFEFRGFADLLGCVRGKYFAGYASELIHG